MPVVGYGSAYSCWNTNLLTLLLDQQPIPEGRENAGCRIWIGIQLLEHKLTYIITRSATYIRGTGECRLSDMDRHTVAGTQTYLHYY